MIDRKHNKHADTGMFELVYRQHISPPQPYMGMNLTLRGTKIQKSPKTKRKRKPSLETDFQLSITCPNSVKSFIQDLSAKLSESELKPTVIPCEELSKNKTTIPSLPSPITASSDEESTDSDESFDVKMCEKHVDVQHISTQTIDFMNENQKVELDSQKELLNRISNPNPIPQENKSPGENKETKKKSHHNCCIPAENLAPRLFRAGTRYNKSNHLRLWRRSTEAAQTNVLLNDWKQRIDKTRASCEEMLTKLKVLRDKDVHNRVKRGINWKAENGTVDEIVRKLAQPQKTEFLERLPIVRDGVQRKCLDTHGISKSRSSSTSPFLTRHLLPQIKDRTRTEGNLFTAVGLSLQCQKTGFSPRDKYLIPMGSLSNALTTS